MKNNNLIFYYKILLIILAIYIIFTFYISSSASVPKFIWEKWYNYISKYDVETMNYGYISINNNNNQDVNYYSINLYEKVANLGKMNLKKGDKILEIGCGRGGGLFYLAKKYPDYDFTGLDLSKDGINECNNKFKLPNLKFEAGDSMSLPYKNNYYSVVINIESSHCYSDFDKFLLEVKRVLLPKTGKFCYADFKANSFHLIKEKFGIKVVEDITENVIMAMEAMDPIRKKQIKELAKNSNFIEQYFLNQFAGLKGSNIYNLFLNGKSAYIHIHALNNKTFYEKFNFIFTTDDIRNFRSYKVPVEIFKNKLNYLNTKYKYRNFNNPQIIMTTTQNYSKSLLKILSNNFRKPVLFKNCGINIDNFELGKNIQIKNNNKIKNIDIKKLKSDTNIFNHMLNNNYFPELNEIFKNEILWYDYFDTHDNHYTGLHNEQSSNICIQIEGTKVWKLIDPKYSDFFIPVCLNERDNQYISLKIKWEKYPDYKNIPYNLVTVEKGDMLFVPSWWWHSPTTIKRSKHISIRTVHNNTFYNEYFSPEVKYKYANILPPLIKLSKKLNLFNWGPVDNTYLNNSDKIVEFYAKYLK